MRLTFTLAALLTIAACDQSVSSQRGARKGVHIGASLLLVEGLDEEGGMAGRTLLPDTGVVAFFRDHVVFANADIVLKYLAPDTHVGVSAGKLTLDSLNTGIPVEMRDSVRFAPLQPLANRFRAYARVEESPGRMATLWRHDVLCRYAHGADRRAPVFLEAAEQGLLRDCRPPINAQVRRWASAQPSERWAASVTFGRIIDSATATTLLQQYGAAPYAGYGVVAGHQLIVRVRPDSASSHVLSRLRGAAIAALEHSLCGLPDAMSSRNGGNVMRSRGGDDPFHGERHMLASAVASERELPRVRAGAPVVYGVDVVGNAAELRRLASDARVRRFEPATKLDDTWVLPGPDLNVASGLIVPGDISALDSAALFSALDAEAARAARQCTSRGGRR
ncbi:MAG: hypothetical protein ACJ77S_03350 [Gemmatimonadaceae bacterium]